MVEIMKCSKFFGTEKLAPTCSDTVLGHRITQGAQNYFLTFSPVMFQSTPKEKCCLWGLFSGCNSDCRLLRKTYLRAMERRIYFHGISLLLSLFIVEKTNVNKFPISSGYTAHKSLVMLRESNTNLASFQNQFVQPDWWAVTGGKKKKKSVF